MCAFIPIFWKWLSPLAMYRTSGDKAHSLDIQVEQQIVSTFVHTQIQMKITFYKIIIFE